MSLLSVVTHICAAVALFGIVSRVAHMREQGVSWRCRAVSASWQTAHVLLAVGLLAELFGLRGAGGLLVTAGLALYFGVRWARRGGEQR